jgi:ornithine cyclodeaminase
MGELVAATKDAFAALASGRAQLPQRAVLRTEGGITLVMPGAIGERALGAKLVSLFPGNPERGRPTLQGLVLLLDPATGSPAGLLDAASLTALRTGAVAGAATDLLARPDARVGAVIGSGPQARTQALALDAVRELDELRFAARDRSKLERFVSDLAPRLRARAAACATPAEAVRAADVVSTATDASAPLFASADLAEGVHLNAVGSFTLQMRELDDETIADARVFVDSREAALEEAGELVGAVRAGRTRPEDWTELGELVLGRSAGRRDRRERTLFKSVGLALQDLAAGALALERARAAGVGRVIEL